MMNDRDMIFCVSCFVFALWDFKNFILKMPSKKGKILLDNAPPKLFFMVNCFLIVGLLSEIYVVMIIRIWFYQSVIWDIMMALLFLWLFLGIQAKGRYYRKENKDMAEIRKFHKRFIIILLVYVLLRVWLLL